MSYDLLVFAPEHAPTEREAFLAWWDRQAEWSEDHDYENPGVSTPALRAWFMEMIEAFPQMNGPYAPEELPEDDSAVTDYSIGRESIYAAFAWSKVEQAYNRVFALAGKHKVGFFDASSETSAVWLPDGSGGLKLAHEGTAQGREGDA